MLPIWLYVDAYDNVIAYLRQWRSLFGPPYRARELVTDLVRIARTVDLSFDRAQTKE